MSADFDLYVSVAPSALGTGGSQFFGLIARTVDSNNLSANRSLRWRANGS